ncbi:hypothetical protein MKW92_035264 [Papaver armeniacum]|nr:hypothetical protein MKW92_035264 [Papaver armeniacum]
MLMQRNINGDTPLHMAARAGSTEIVRLFLNHAQNSHLINHYNQRRDEDCVNVDVEKGIAATELVPAAEYSATKINAQQLVRIANKLNNTALHEALRYQPDSGIPQLLLSADPGFEYLANDYDETPLYLAVKFGIIDLVEHILNIRPSQSYGAPGGRTMLHALALRVYESNKGAFSKSVYLLRHLVKEVDKNGRTALHYAAYTMNNGFVDAVMKVDPSVCYMPDKDGMTALHHASKHSPWSKHAPWENKEMMKTMLRHCPDCWQVLDNEGRNFLHVAAYDKNPEVLKCVLNEISSDLVVDSITGMKDKNGKTPCELSYEFLKIIKLHNRGKQHTWNSDQLVWFDNVVQVWISLLSLL